MVWLNKCSLFLWIWTGSLKLLIRVYTPRVLMLNFTLGVRKGVSSYCRYIRGVHFWTWMVYERVRDWTSGHAATPLSPPPPRRIQPCWVPSPAVQRPLTPKIFNSNSPSGGVQCIVSTPSVVSASATLWPVWRSTHQHRLTWMEHWITWYDPSASHLGRNASFIRGSSAWIRSTWQWPGAEVQIIPFPIGSCRCL